MPINELLDAHEALTPRPLWAVMQAGEVYGEYTSHADAQTVAETLNIEGDDYDTATVEAIPTDYFVLATRLQASPRYRRADYNEAAGLMRQVYRKWISR